MDNIQIEETEEYRLEEALNELYDTISPYTQLGEINFNNIHLLVEYLIQQDLGQAAYEELKYQLGYTCNGEIYYD